MSYDALWDLKLKYKGVSYLSDYFKKLSNTFYSNGNISWLHKENILLGTLKNEKNLTDMFFSLRLGYFVNASYKGRWLRHLGYKDLNLSSRIYSYSDKFTIDYLKKNEPYNNISDNVSLQAFIHDRREEKDGFFYNNLEKDPYHYIGIQFLSFDRILFWSCYLRPDSTYSVKNVEFKSDNLIGSRYFPYHLDIDSEFVDKISPNTSPFTNLRIRTPVSVTVSSMNVFNGSTQIYHFFYDKNALNKTHLFAGADTFFYCEPYNEKNDKRITPFSEDLDKSTIELSPDGEISPFYLYLKEIYKIVYTPIMLHQMISGLVFSPGYTGRVLLYYCSPAHVKKNKNFKNAYILPIKFFFSLKDIRYFLGTLCYREVEKFFVSRRITTFEKYRTKSPFGFILEINQLIRIYIRIQILDISGLSSGGLKQLAELTDVVLEDKESNLLDKEDMRNTLDKYPSVYMNYCRQDAKYLTKMTLQTWFDLFELYELFNISRVPALFDFSNSSRIMNYMRLTNGSNIAKFFEEYIYSLDPSIKTTLNLLGIRAGNFEQIPGISMGSSKFLNFIGSHAIIGSYVAGGRCCNERPFENSFSYGADIDLSSCYGTSIRNLEYPIGIPFVLRPLKDTKETEDGNIVYLKEPNVGTLKDVMKSYKRYLVPGLWYAVVSTLEPLSFDFDLLISKNMSAKTMKKKGLINDSSTVPGEQFILTREIKNGVLVQPTLDIIDKIATRKEKKEIYEKLYVKVMVFYDKRYRCNDFKEFNLKVTKELSIKKSSSKSKNKKGRPRLNKDTVGIGSNKDKPSYWISIPMENVVKKLIDRRKELRALFAKTGEKIYDSKQKHIKLTINMLYGITASKFFNVSNLCFANNITGLARASVWIKAKSLNLCQCITDGGIYELNHVNHWHHMSNKHKPGFNALTINSWSQKNSLIGPLGDRKDWVNILEKGVSDINYREEIAELCDTLATEHIQHFINYYKLPESVFPYEVEHKVDHFFLKATTLNRGHYSLYNLNKKFISKVRGCQQKEGNDHILSPIFEIMKAKMFNRDAIIKNITYTKYSLLKSNELRKINANSHLHHPLFMLHDTYIHKMNFRIKCDFGKYSTINNYKNTSSAAFQKEHYSYLDPKYFIIKQDGTCIIKNNYWKNYHKILKDNCLGDEVASSKRLSKSNKKDLLKKLIIGRELDIDFSPDFEKSIDLNSYGIEDTYDSSEENGIPLLTDDNEENIFTDEIITEQSNDFSDDENEF